MTSLLFSGNRHKKNRMSTRVIINTLARIRNVIDNVRVKNAFSH